MILVDTSVWIEFFKGINSRQNKIFHELIGEDEDICLTEIVLTEILQGIKNDIDNQTMRSYLLEFPMYSPKGLGTYIKASDIYRECRKRGITVRKTVDCIIAAVCLESGLSLLHHDPDFDHIAQCTELEILE